MMAQVLYPTTFSSVTQPGQQGGLGAQARDPGRNKKGCKRGCPDLPGTTKGGLGWASAPWPGAQERQGKGPRYQPFPHSLPHSFQQPFFDHLLLGAEDSQPKDTASGRSSSGEDNKINKHLSPQSMSGSRGRPLARMPHPSLPHQTLASHSPCAWTRTLSRTGMGKAISLTL